jgi:hypothetical protein
MQRIIGVPSGLFGTPWLLARSGAFQSAATVPSAGSACFDRLRQVDQEMPGLSFCVGCGPSPREEREVTRVKSNRPRGGNQPQRTWVLDGNNSENPPFLFSCKSGAFATTAICSSKIHTCHVLNFKPGFVVVANAPLLHLFEKHPERGIHLG